MTKNIKMLAVLVVAAAAVSAKAQTLRLAAGSTLRLDGQSTLHAFSSTATRLDAAFDVTPPGDLTAGALKAFTLDVPVAGLKSEHSGLDKNMRASLKGDAFPNIEFKLASYQWKGAEGAKPAHVTAHGTLEIAGQTREVDLESDARPAANGWEFSGSKDLKMTDYGIKPPSMVFMKTKDEVKVLWDIKLEPANTPRTP